MAAFPKHFNVASNPHGTRRSTSSRPPAAKKGKKMAKAGTKKKARANGGKKRNAAHHPKQHRRRSRNPQHGLSKTIGSPKEFVTGAVSGLVSAVATRQIPQLILGANNTGWEGYLANFLTTVVATWGAGMFAGSAAGRGAAIGGGVIILDRILSEQVSPISSYLALSGVGDANAYSKLGTIRQGFYTHPNLQNPDGSLYVPDPFNDAAVQAVVARYPQIAAAMMAAAPAGKMGAVNPSSLRRHTASGMLMSSRFMGRFNQ